MAYWDNGPDGCDFAFGAIGVYVLFIKKRMMDDCKNVMNTSHTEQSIVASIVCLRLIGEQFPKSLSVHFRRKDFEKAKKMSQKLNECR